MIALLIGLNILAALFLIGVVLLQSGKGADMGAAFGGSSSTVFGASGAGNLLTKLTAASAAVFMLTSLALAVTSARQRSVFDAMPEPTPAAAPAPATALAPTAPDGGEAAGAPAEEAGSPSKASTESHATLDLPVEQPGADAGKAGAAASAPKDSAPAEGAPGH